MKCNNDYCYWCSFEQCCHESERDYDNIEPNQLDCRESLRKDWEEVFWWLVHELIKMGLKKEEVKKMNLGQMDICYKILKNKINGGIIL